MVMSDHWAVEVGQSNSPPPFTVAVFAAHEQPTAASTGDDDGGYKLDLEGVISVAFGYFRVDGDPDTIIGRFWENRVRCIRQPLIIPQFLAFNGKGIRDGCPLLM
jgi:hypothetical protein